MGSSPTITCGFWELCYVFFPILKFSKQLLWNQAPLFSSISKFYPHFHLIESYLFPKATSPTDRSDKNTYCHL